MDARFVDLITTSSMMYQYTIPDTTYLLHLEEQVDSSIIGRDIAPECGVYRARLYLGKFDKAKMRGNVSNDSFRTAIDKLDVYHYLHGSIFIILRNDDLRMARQNWLFEAHGRLSRVGNNKCIFYLTKWHNTSTKEKPSWTPGGVVSHPPESFKPLNDEIKKTIETQILQQPKRPAILQEVGVEIQHPRMMLAPPIPEYVPEPIGELGVSKANERMRNIVPPVSDIPSNIERGNVGKQWREEPVNKESTEINRSEMLKVRHTLIEKANDIEKRQEQIIEYITEKCINYEFDESLIEDLYHNIGMRIIENWGKQPEVGVGFTGRALFKQAMLRVTSTDKDTKMVSQLFDMYGFSPDIVELWMYNDMDAIDSNPILQLLIKYRTNILYSLYETVLQLNCDLEKVDNHCRRYGYSVFEMMIVSPYRIGIAAPISVKDLDKLAMISKLFDKPEQLSDRSVSYYHEYLTDENLMEGSTIIAEQQARIRVRAGYHLSKAEYTRLMQTRASRGIYFDYNLTVNMRCYFGLYDMDMSLPLSGWKENYTDCYLQSVNAFDTYIQRGIGIRVVLDKPYIIDFDLFRKEIFIYEKLNKMSSSIPPIENIDMYINRFELSQGSNFKLEERQRQAIKQCFVSNNTINVITGGAGSGKTTLIKAIVYVYTTALGYTIEIDDENKIPDIVFVAPTGKAANRIYESTGFPARTIHSKFRIGLTDDAEASDIVFKVLFCDECSMINLDVMYQMLKKVPDDARIIFSGDINQLVPIGFGQCFADIINFAPVTTLNVMKRAEGTSLIAKNAKRLVSGYETLSVGNDFKIKNVTDFKNSIAETIDYLVTKGSNIDDIQVISPVATDKYEWGTRKMNIYLQELLNHGVPVTQKIHQRKHKDSYDTFQVGDRVIQTKNNTEMIQYIVENNQYVANGQGVLNGDIGKIRRILTSAEMFISTTDNELLIQCENPNAIFVDVEYIVAGSTYSIIYTTKTTNPDGKPTYNGYETSGGNISQIQLGYAITVHKMQGSQSKHIILLWYPMRRKDFLSRNMLYTAITRAEKDVTIFGDDFAIESARHIISNDARTTYLKLYFRLANDT